MGSLPTAVPSLAIVEEPSIMWVGKGLQLKPGGGRPYKLVVTLLGFDSGVCSEH